MIINSIAYQKGQRLQEVPIEDISEIIKQENTFIWLGLCEPDEAMLSKIQEEFRLHELAIEDAHNAHQRPKIETYGDSLFIVLKTAQLAKLAGSKTERVVYGETHLFLGSNFLISIRHGTSTKYTQVRERCEQMPKMLSKGPGFALYALLDFIVDHYQPIVQQFEKEFDALEADIFKAQFDKLAIARVYELKRELLKLQNAALPVSDICNELMRFHEEIIPKELRAYLRDIQDHVARLISALNNMREMLTNAMQVNLAMVGVAQNEIVKQLAGWGAILAIPTVLFSLYGMNFKFMPELQSDWGYPMVLGITGFSCFLLYRKLKRTGWI